MDGDRPWQIVNPGEIDIWMIRRSPSEEIIAEVISLLNEILHRAPDFGLEIPVLLGTPKRTNLSDSCRASITWSLLKDYGDSPRGVYLYQIESWDADSQ